MAYRILYHPRVEDEDLPTIDRKLDARIRRAIEHRLAAEPTYYGEPLRHHLKGFWKLRVGDYRVSYRIVEQNVLVVAVGHRKEIYALPPYRFIWSPL